LTRLARTPAPIPRHIRCVVAIEGCVDRDRIEIARAQFHQSYRTALRAMGQGAAGAAGNRGAADLGFRRMILIFQPPD